MAGKNQNATTFPNMIGMQQVDYNAGWNGWQSKPDAFEERGKQILADVANRMKEVEAQYAQYQKADAKANRNLRVPMAPNNIAKLQKALWEAGAFQGVKDRRGRDATYQTAVDGLTGKMTRAAIANAQKAGYTVDEKTGAVTKVQANPQQVVQQPTQKRRVNGLANMYGMTHAAATGGMSMTPPVQQGTPGNIVSAYLDNLYPYGYVLQSSERENARKAPGWFSHVAGLYAGVNSPVDVDKLWTGFFEKTNAKKALDEFVELDLTNPQQRKRGEELKRQYFTNFRNSSIDHIQQSARSRYDANSLYAGIPQKFNTWMVNPDYESPSAKAAGVPTYTYRDPKLRKMQQDVARRHGMSRGVGAHVVQGDATTTFNNYTVNRMNKDGSGRYVDKWDFLGPNVGNLVFIGDTIPAR